MGSRSLGNRILSLPLLVAVAALGMVGHAIWTDAGTSYGNTFITGSVDIAATPTTAFLNLNPMAPGDSTGATLEVQNLSNLDFRYSVTVNADYAGGAALRDVLVLTVKTKTANPCSTFDGITLYRGSLNPTGGLVMADERTLTAGSSEVLCFKLDLPVTAPNSVQGTSASAGFTFSAEQL